MINTWLVHTRLNSLTSGHERNIDMPIQKPVDDSQDIREEALGQARFYLRGR